MKQIVKNFNNLIKKTIFKVENKTNNKFHVSKFSKYLISAIVVLFIYIFYLSIPLLYDKNWIQNKIVTELGNEFNINLGNSFDFSYRILPKPHYLIRDGKTPLAEIKTLNVFINQTDVNRYLNVELQGSVFLKECSKPDLIYHEVSKDVNKPTNNSASLIQNIG